MKDNTMKKWQPYASLIEQEVELKKMRVNREKVEKPILFDDKIQEINYILTNYHDQELTIQFFKDGYLYNATDKIKRIDVVDESILLYSDNLKIKLSDITDIID